MLITLDFETYYDKDYTLKRLSTSEYVRDPRFEAINCSVMVDDGSPEVLWGHDAISDRLRELDPDDVELLAHHAHFEGLILSHHFGFVPRTYRDTLSMARACFAKGLSNELASVAERLGVANKLEMPDFKGKHLADFDAALRASVADYVAGDVLSCYQAYGKLLQMLPPEELDLIDITVRMFADPVLRLDRPRVEAELAKERARKAAELAAAGVDKTVLMSNDKLAAALTAAGIVPPTKVSATTKKSTWAMAQTDLEFIGLQKHPNPVVQQLVKARLAVKGTQAETRCVRLLRASESEMRLPVYLNYCGAHTTRWSGGDKLNFQNLERGGELRKSLLAPPGHVIIPVDSSQIEVRMLAWLAGERWLLDEFARGKDSDPYSAFATKAFGRVITKRDPERQVAKPCVLLLGYGGGAWKLQHTLAIGTYGPPVDVELSVCQGFVNTYRSTSRAIVALWNLLGQVVGDMALGREGSYKALSWGKDKILLPGGMTLHYPDTRALFEQVRLGPIFGNRVEEKMVDGSYSSGHGRTRLYGGFMAENVVQALARVVVAEQMRQIAKRYRVVMMSHDEPVYIARREEADEALAFGLECMRQRPAWAPDLPLDAEGAYAEHYSK